VADSSEFEGIELPGSWIEDDVVRNLEHRRVHLSLEDPVCRFRVGGHEFDDDIGRLPFLGDNPRTTIAALGRDGNHHIRIANITAPGVALVGKDT
jgi:hypothetical protein